MNNGMPLRRSLRKSKKRVGKFKFAKGPRFKLRKYVFRGLFGFLVFSGAYRGNFVSYRVIPISFMKIVKNS
jgi:hypothetical protein